MDDAHKQRQAVSPGDGEHEGTVQNEVHFLLRRGGCAAHHHNGIGRGGDAFLVNGHAGGVLGLREIGRRIIGHGGKVRDRRIKDIRDAQSLQAVCQIQIRRDVELWQSEVDDEVFALRALTAAEKEVHSRFIGQQLLRRNAFVRQ